MGAVLATLVCGRLGSVRRQGVAIMVSIVGWGVGISGLGVALLGAGEWLTLDQALWLPREDQLRELLGDRLEVVRRLEDEWELTYAVAPGYVRTVTDADLECAYAKAILTL